MDDISHVNFTDRDHLWFDPGWKPSNTGSSTHNSNNNSSTHNSSSNKSGDSHKDGSGSKANIFVNEMDNLGPEYAEVEGSSSSSGKSPRDGGQQEQGPYATTNLVDSPFLTGQSQNSLVRG